MSVFQQAWLRLAVTLSAVALVACGTDAPNAPASGLLPDGGAGADGAPMFDAGGVGASDSGAGAADTGALDTAALDTAALDTGAADTGAGGSGANDTGVTDTGLMDTGAPDTGVADTGVADTGAPDTGSADTGITDTGITDAGTTDTSDGGSSDGGSTPQGSEFNGGFVGGQCSADSQCNYSNSFCIKEAEGFPKGMCSQSCTKFCPDKTGMTTTFCITGKEVGVSTPPGLCTARCDFGKSATGCRPGYSCVKMQRYGDPSTEVFACVPGQSGAGVKLNECQQKLLARGVGFSPLPDPKGIPKGGTKPACFIPNFLSVDADILGVGFRASSQSGSKLKMKMNCEFAHAVADMAELLAKKGVVEVVHYGTYNCRYISGTKTLSQHSFANALDVAGLKTKDGAYHSVLKDWEKGVAKPKTTSGQLLRWFADTMYAKHVFNIILTPEYNAAHANHFHVDMTAGSWFMQGFSLVWGSGAGGAGGYFPPDE